MKICCWQHVECSKPRQGNSTYCKEHRADYERMRNYNLSIEELDALVNVTICEACGIDLTNKKHCIDHCHDTGKVRGILCSPCNLTAGRIESIQGKNIIKYLNRTNDKKNNRV